MTSASMYPSEFGQPCLAHYANQVEVSALVHLLYD